ncbi:MAG: hypothetical protein KJ624_00900 [Chloroflexi bacterium]|nr:hypothetical protein [Chloroflexota bacterium]
MSLYIGDRGNHRVRMVNLATGTITTFAGTGVGGFAGDGGPATAAQLTLPVGVASGSGYLYITEFAGNRVRRVDLATGTITTFAGGTTVPTGDGGPAMEAQLSGPYGVAVDSGNLYIADTANNRVRRVNLAAGTITTVAGNGTSGFGGDGGPATAAQLSGPRSAALGSGNLYIADSGNNRVRRVDLATGTITTLAGNGAVGSGGDGGPATAAQLNNPIGLALGSGNLYIADSGNNRVRRVDLATGTISIFAGSGTAGFGGDGGPATAAQLNNPNALTLDSANLYISEGIGNRIRRVDLATGTMTTFAGTGAGGFAGDGGPATAAQLNTPIGLAVDSANLYIGDSQNNRVRRVDLATGTITSLAGTGVGGFVGDGGPAAAAQLNFPCGLAVGSGNLYIAERSNNRIRRVDLR